MKEVLWASFFIGEGGPDPCARGIVDKVGAMLRRRASEFQAGSVPRSAAIP
jgi:hypothetical protein